MDGEDEIIGPYTAVWGNCGCLAEEIIKPMKLTQGPALGYL